MVAIMNECHPNIDEPKQSANAQLAALSHLLLPMAEALEGLDSCAKWDEGDTPVAVELNYTEFAAALAASRTVLAQLEEALG